MCHKCGSDEHLMNECPKKSSHYNQTQPPAQSSTYTPSQPSASAYHAEYRREPNNVVDADDGPLSSLLRNLTDDDSDALYATSFMIDGATDADPIHASTADP